MKLERGKTLEEASNMSLEGFDATISGEEMGKLWDILQNPYKNPVGAIVREYVSNSFDAHAEIGKEHAVHVRLALEDSGWYWSTEDFGVGLSPDRVENVFCKYLKSTKENTNDLIGAFGIGSKSGLAYSDIVFIRTRYNGVEYEYLLRKSASGSPRVDKLSETPTNEGNGTRIRIRLNTDATWADSEVQSFKRECLNQLAYFDNVYFDVDGISNDYKVYEGKHFIARSSSSPFTGLHLCLGKVAYPIDWDNLPSEIDYISLNMALKFEIGDLDIIPTREDVKYTPKTKQAIVDKIESLKGELSAMWEAQNDFVIDDIAEYVDKYECHPQIGIDFGDGYVSRFSLLELMEKEDLKWFEFTPFIGSEINPHRGTWSNNPFFDYECPKKVVNGTVRKGGWYSPLNCITAYPVYRLKKGEKPFPMKNRFIQSELEDGNTFYFLTKRPADRIHIRNYRIMLGLDQVPKGKWRETIKLYQDTVQDTLIKRTKSYTNVVITDEYRERNKKVTTKPEGTATVYHASVRYYGGTIYDGFIRGKQLKLETLKSNELYVIGNRDEKEPLLAMATLIRKYTGVKEEYMHVFYTAKNVVETLSKQENVWTMDKFLSRESKIFKKVVTGYHINCKYNELINIFDAYDWGTIYHGLEDKIKEFQKDYEYFNRSCRTIEVRNFIKDVCYPYALEHNIFDENMKSSFLSVKEYFDGLELLNYLPFHEEDYFIEPAAIAKYIMQYNRSVKDPRRFKKLNSWFYVSLNEEEVSWLKRNKPEYDLYKYRKLKKVS